MSLDRNLVRDAGGIRNTIRNRQPRLAEVADGFGATAAQLALAFALSHPGLATGLVGATRIEDLDRCRRTRSACAGGRDPAAVNELAISGVAHFKLLNPHDDIRSLGRQPSSGSQ